MSKTDRTLSLIVKINFLVLGLGVVIYLSYSLRQDGLPPTISSILGIPTKTADTLEWCDTRVSAISLANGRRVYQEGDKWMAEDPRESGPLNFLEVERWLGQYCIVPVEKQKSEFKAKSLVATVEFIDGTQAEFKADGKGLFLWKGQVFSSAQLESAFLSLMDLPVDSRPQSH